MTPVSQNKDPRVIARKLLRDAGICDLRGLVLEDFIQWHPNCYLQESGMTGSQGRIQFLGSTALITINSKITNKGQKRFVLAHEFGHFNLHFDLKPMFNCDEESFKQWLSKGGHEQEANEFAAELLMPKNAFAPECSGLSFTTELVRHLADRFETSLTATSRRIVEQGPFNMALVYSENGVIKWHTEHSSFPLTYIVTGAQTPLKSAAKHFFNTGLSKAKVISPDEWYFMDNAVSKYSKHRIREHVLPLPYYNGVLSFLCLES
ncbi:ImmA/IrrE family metallo-endopeptidase [Rudanella paleaurantiibacter]|uniref:ImmA/IrrE family metallo-endopeptidase n=1 Tax=Rudanella paleaurantiibacter TaxID=2614655 RepID=A0A7J5TSF9_9BACT|nr:ImmA/IrrE family metallo-endopeptidase [Rudanella paleaurantiibacter]KAB7725503.1 ImmA/IrrE family metallo-endopeptidase [Rudanella paleaurantiibacter]